MGSKTVGDIGGHTHTEKNVEKVLAFGRSSDHSIWSFVFFGPFACLLSVFSLFFKPKPLIHPSLRSHFLSSLSSLFPYFRKRL